MKFCHKMSPCHKCSILCIYYSPVTLNNYPAMQTKDKDKADEALNKWILTMIALLQWRTQYTPSCSIHVRLLSYLTSSAPAAAPSLDSKVWRALFNVSPTCCCLWGVSLPLTCTFTGSPLSRFSLGGPFLRRLGTSFWCFLWIQRITK